MIEGLVELKNNTVVKNDDNYFIKDNCDIKVNSNCNIYDFSNDKKINVEVESGVTVNYYIINSANNERSFKVNGTLNVLEISLNKAVDSLSISLEKENANTYVRNLAIANNKEIVFKQNAIHNYSSTFSNIENIGIAFDNGNITFDTTGKIEKGKNKSKCSQLSRGIVMDNTSTITAKPILLIDEFDCFANHGASIGKMSDEDLFYLMSRGLTKDEAFLLILQGIVKPFVDGIPNEELRNNISESVNKLILK